MGEKRKLLKVVLIWNDLIIEEKTLSKQTTITIGQGKGITFPIDLDGFSKSESHTLFEPQEDGSYKLYLLEKMSGDFSVSGKDMEMSKFLKEKCKKDGDIYHTEIKPFDSGNIDFGEVTISWAFVEEADKIALSKGARTIEPTFINSLIMTTIVHVVLVVLMLLNRSDLDELNFTDIPDRFAKVIIEEEEKKEEDPEVEKEKKEGKVAEDIGKKAAGKEGKIGDKDTPKYIKTKLPKARQELITQNLKARGVFGAMGSTLHGGGMNQLVAGDSGVGNRLAASFNGTSGDEFIAGQGSGGMGFRGTGTGGGGTGYGRIGGTGDIDTGGGRGTKVSLTKGQKGERKIIAKPTTGATFGNFCKQSDIQKVVTQKSKTIQYCYEKELQRFRDLKGKVKLRWIIDLEGKVESVSIDEDTIKNASLVSCLKRQVERWQFVKPDGGKCIVAFPFLFSAE